MGGMFELPVAAVEKRERMRRWPRLTAVFVLALATRLPFALTTPGVGGDPDAWRLVLAGQMLRMTGEYRTSRPPSYPAVELLSAALSGAPWVVFVLLTSAAGAVGVAAFGDLLLTLKVDLWWLPVAGFALTPVIYRSDLTFMDYTWSLAPLLCGLALLARRRELAAGALLGLSVACRPSAAIAAAVTVAVVLLFSRTSASRVLTVAASALVVCAAFFAVPLVTFGSAILTAYPSAVPLSVAAARASTGVWGAAGAVAVAVAVVLVFWRLTSRRATPTSVQWSWVMASIANIIAQLAVFAALPVDPGYLVPLVAMVWLLIGIVLCRGVVVGVVALVGASAFFAPTSSLAFGLTVPQDAAQRTRSFHGALDAAAAIRALPPQSTVVAGYAMPQVLALLPREVLTDRRLAGPRREFRVPEDVPLPRGGRLVYSLSSGEAALNERAFRLFPVDLPLPLLPASR